MKSAAAAPGPSILGAAAALRGHTMLDHRTVPLLALLLGWAPQALALPPRPAKPNVLLLISDDLRPQLPIEGFGADGAPITTPRLAALAAESFVFTRAYCQEALCAPSRNSFRESVPQPRAHSVWLHSRRHVSDPSANGASVNAVSGRRPDTTKSWQFVDSFREPAVGGENWTALPQLFLQNGWTTVRRRARPLHSTALLSRHRAPL